MSEEDRIDNINNIDSMSRHQNVSKCVSAWLNIRYN